MDRTCDQAGIKHTSSNPYVVPVVGIKVNGEPAYAVLHGLDYLNDEGVVVSPREWAWGYMPISQALRAIDLHCGTTHHS